MNTEFLAGFFTVPSTFLIAIGCLSLHPLLY
jgi:hypothetical protein